MRKSLLVWFLGFSIVAPAAQSTSRVTAAPGGLPANGRSGAPSVSADGRLVVFQSGASNLVSGDTNNKLDIFLADRQAGLITRISNGLSGTQAQDDSFAPAIAAEGRYVAFVSRARNLAAGDFNRWTDIYVYDRQTGIIGLISKATGGASPDADCWGPAISADGRWIAYHSSAGNLVSGDTNGVSDVFLHDRQTGQTLKVSRATGGGAANGPSLAPSLSADGNRVAFISMASNLVANDTEVLADVFVYDRSTGVTSRVSVTPAGTGGNGDSGAPSISANGRFVAFVSRAGNLVAGDSGIDADVLVRDLQTGTTSLVSRSSAGTPGNGDSSQPVISADGRVVIFASWAENLVAGDDNGRWDIFAHDRQNGQTVRLSAATGGAPADGDSERPAATADGSLVVYGSLAANLTAGDTNGQSDVFASTRPAGLLAGDLNHDGSVNLTDVFILVHYLAGTSGLPAGTILADADLNSDGLVNSADLARLLQLGAGL